MVATKIRAALVVAGLGVMIVSYQNCAVDVANTTPGASVVNCAPTAQDLTDIQPILQNFLMATGTLAGTSKMACGNCHLDNSGDSGSAVFTIFHGSATDATIQTNNFCSLQRKATLLSNKILVGPHTGGQFLQSEVQALLDFVQTHY